MGLFGDQYGIVAPRSDDATRAAATEFPIARSVRDAWYRRHAAAKRPHDTAAPPSTPGWPSHPTSTSPWRLWGPYLSGRQWGTVREDYSADGDAWTYLPFEQAHAPCLPLGRGRARRHLRPVRIPQHLGGAVERPRPDAQGTAVRAHQRRGQPRRGRQGVLVGDGRHAHALVDALALPLSAGRVPVRAAAPRERRPRPRRPRVRARRHRRPRRRPVLRRHRHLREGCAGRRRDRRRGDQPRTGPGAAAPAAAGVVPQHLGVGTRRPHARRCIASTRPSGSARTSARSSASTSSSAVRTRWSPRASGRAGLRQRDQRRRAVRRRTRTRLEYTKDGINSRVVHGDESAVNADGTGTKAAFWYRFDAVRAGRDRSGAVAAGRQAIPDEHALRRRVRRGAAPTAPARPTTSTRRVARSG